MNDSNYHFSRDVETPTLLMSSSRVEAMPQFLLLGLKTCLGTVSWKWDLMSCADPASVRTHALYT